MTESVFQGRSLLSTRDYTKDELMYLTRSIPPRCWPTS